jgi:hypothetical protein
MMGDFEKDLQDAFEGAEFTPSPKVWDGVKAGLTPKKKVGIFYMWQTYGVAASILLMLTLGFLFRDELFGSGNVTGPSKALTENKKEDPDNDPESSKAATKENDRENTGKEKIMNPEGTEVAGSTVNPNMQADNAAGNKASGLNNTGELKPGSALTGEAIRTVPGQSFEEQVLRELEGARSVSDNAPVEIYVLGPQDLAESMAALRIRWELKNLVEPMELDTSNIAASPETMMAKRTSLSGSFGGGSFNPNGGSGSATNALQENRVTNDPLVGAFNVQNGEESQKQLGSISIGGGINFELGPRWSFKTGLRYSQYRYATTSNAYTVEDGNNLPVYLNATYDLSQARYAGEYELTNTIHSISVPVQMGYKILDKERFALAVNGGLGIDYFINYTVKGDLSFLDARKVDLGETDYLNRFNVNVLAGLELSYMLNDKLALSGEMFFRQYIPSLEETDGTATATPSFFGFGLGINYYLRKKK